MVLVHKFVLIVGCNHASRISLVLRNCVISIVTNLPVFLRFFGAAVHLEVIVVAGWYVMSLGV
jgi:hypothetical protein